MNRFLERVEKRTGMHFDSVEALTATVHSATMPRPTGPIPHEQIIQALLSDPAHFKWPTVAPATDPLFTPKEQQLIHLRANNELSLEKSGAVLHMKRDKVMMLEAKAFLKLRRYARSLGQTSS